MESLITLLLGTSLDEVVQSQMVIDIPINFTCRPWGPLGAAVLIASLSYCISSSTALPGELMAEPDEASLPWFPDPLLLDDLEQSDTDTEGAEEPYAYLLAVIALLCSLSCMVHCSACYCTCSGM